MPRTTGSCQAMSSPPSSQCRLPMGKLSPQGVCWTPVEPWKPLPAPR